MKRRPYQHSDFESVIQLWWDSWHSSSGYKHHRPIEDWQQRWDSLVETHKIVVIEHQATIIAFAAVNTQTCVLSQIFVSSKWKHQGIGQKLIHWAHSQCPEGFTLKTASDNKESRAFYESIGMTQTGHSINDFNGKEEIEYSAQPEC